MFGYTEYLCMKLNLLKFFTSLLPLTVQEKMLRDQLHIPEKLDDAFVFKIAETEKELEAAFRLVYESYYKVGYCQKNPYEMHATIYHALATTSTLLAIHHGMIVGTLTIIRDNVLKLPLETYFDISPIREKSQRIAEISGLAFHPQYLGNNGCMLALFKLMHEYCVNYFGVNHLVATVPAKDAFFYKTLFLFKNIAGIEKKKNAAFEAVAIHLDLLKAPVTFELIYGDKKLSSNLYDFFLNKNFPNLKLPLRIYNKINYPLVSVNYFQDLFVDKLGLGKSLEERTDLAFVHNPFAQQRAHQRIDVELSGELATLNGTMKFSGKIKDVSRMGFRLFCEETLPIGIEFNCKIKIDDEIYTMITARSVWSNEFHELGFLITEADLIWREYIDYLYQDQQGKIA
jgi:hypothetical protein